MDYQTSVQALGLCVAVNTPALLWGLPGQGKTSVVNSISETYGLHSEVVIASIREPSDFSGLPFIQNGSTYLSPPRWAQDAVNVYNEHNRATLVLYDEISTAPPAVQAAVLRPILEGYVGDLQLPPTTRSVATANPPTIAADGWDMSPPLANRFTHLDWALDAVTVQTGFSEGFPQVPMPLMPPPARMEKLVARSKRIVGAFLGARPSLISNLSEDFGSSQSVNFRASDYAFTSPRAWETVAKLHAAHSAARLPDGSKLSPSVFTILSRGTVGVPATVELEAFLKALDLQDPRKIIAGKEEFSVPKSGDQIHAALSGLEYTYSSIKEPSVEYWNNYGLALSAVCEAGTPDIAYPYSRRWLDARPEGAIPTGVHVRAMSGILTELNDD